jgi:4-hydroxybenzoate polyprenyltransferase
MLYAAAIFWTIGYDTIYAIQDVIDDEAVGIKSTAIKVGKWLIPFVALCYFLMIAFLALAGKFAGAGAFYFMGVGAVAMHAIWQIRHVSYHIAMAGRLFRSNQWLGLTLLAFILLDRLIHFH